MNYIQNCLLCVLTILGMFRKRPPLVVSEPDVDAALCHLRNLPFRPVQPKPWDRNRFLGTLRETIGDRPKIGQTFDVAPGVYAIIEPFGIDLAGMSETEERYQVWLAIRSVGTDPGHVTEL